MRRLLLILLAVATPVHAQAPAEADSSPRFPVLCDGDTVRTIVVNAQRPPFKGHMQIWRRVARSIGLHHATTRQQVIERIVTLEQGEPCTEFRRSESERLLRAQPYLASATVRTLAEPGGGIRVEIETVDEVPALFDVRVRRGQPAGAMAGNENIFGLGIHAEARIERGFEYRNGYGGTFVHHHFLGRPYQLTIDGQRDPIGGHWGIAAGHPFLTDLQRVAWHAGISHSHKYAALTRGGDSFLALGVRRDAWDVGGVLRFGPPGQLWLLGGVVTGERTVPADLPELITRDGRRPAAPLDRELPYAPHRATRLNGVAGIRVLDFARARGLDALTATQDIARGVQIGLIAGHGVPGMGEDDMFFAANVFGAIGSERSYAGVQVDGEARYDNDTREWDGIVGSGRAAWYLKPSARWTTVASVEAAGGWNVLVPFHLRLDDRQGGIRADVANEYLGTRRAVARLEQRWVGGTFGRRADFGLAAFVEGGRLWRGDAPFGIDIRQQTAVGLSLLGAAPPGAQRMLRIDVAFPISGPASKRVEFRVAFADWTRAFWREPGEVGRARAGAVLADIFSWP